MTAGRLVVVLGYSDRRELGLHPICADRLAHAATVSHPNDVVVLSGWARTPGARPEAELMSEAWTGACRELVIDPDARHTVGNATNALDDLVRTGADTVVVVTSRWHAPRARVIFAWLFRGRGVRVVASSPPEPFDPRAWAHELLRWLIMPIQLSVAEPGSVHGLLARLPLRSGSVIRRGADACELESD
ncbi:YdcF family protein [Ilumatobacter sp.]|uniref:YdcF family protein n=1 Tax=Ilumatobacter sp. TaxID=1967498 RepID=UPI003AF9A5C1